MTYPPVSSGHHSSKSSAEPQRYLAINDFADALQAFPADIIRQFTLLKEIDAKCINTQPELNHQISKYVKFAEREAPVEQKHSKLGLIKDLLLSNLPCYEEKMTIASLATDLVAKHIDRINNDFELIINHEIPKIVKFGPKNHPAIIPDSKLPENKSAQTQRSESRREAIAAKKAAQNDDATGAVSVSGSSSSGHHSSVGSGSSIAGSSSNASGKSKNGRNHHSSTISNSKGKESTPGASRKKKSSISNGSNNSSFGDRNQHSNLHAASGNGHVTTSSGISHNNDVDYGSSTANSQRYGKSAHSITAGNSSKLATAPALSQASSSGSQNNSRSNSSTAVKTENENSRKRQKVVKKSSSSSSNKIVRKDLGHDNAKSQNSNAALSSTGGNHQDEDFEPEEEDNANDVYCICQQVSFGEMICCDNDKCKIQWFHLQCVGLNSPPTGTWYCDDCKKQSHMR